MPRYRVLILGGYGNFGGQICRRLAVDRGIELLVAGRDPRAAERFVATLTGDPHQPLRLDVDSPSLGRDIAACRPDLVIHTSGPFQQQHYGVARACLEAGCDYVDLAYSRAFVEGFGELDEAARTAGCVLISGASTVPALSAAVVREHAPELAQLENVSIGITPGQRTPRGRATVAGVLAYCGRPFQRLVNGGWEDRYGWQDLRWFPHPQLGRRLWGACDVPDLALFPQRWPGLRSVSFHAGLELPVLQFALYTAAIARRLRLVRDWSRHADRLLRLASPLDRFGTDHGGMFVTLAGRDHAGQALRIDWWLTARDGSGPFIPCVASIALARRFAAQDRPPPGARTAIDAISLDTFAQEVINRPIEWSTTRYRA